MNNFIKYSSLEVKMMYILVIVLLIHYAIFKYKHRKYIFSIFNITSIIIVPMVIPFIILGPFQYNDTAWLKLGNSSSYIFINYLNKNFIINSLGISMFIIFSIVFEFYSRCGSSLSKYVFRLSKNISSAMVLIINILVLFTWYLVVLSTIKSMPIFTNRTFASQYGVQTIYNTLNALLTTLAPIYLAKYFIKKKKIYLFVSIINIMTLFFTGNRGPVLFLVINILILKLYISSDNLKDINTNIIKLCTIMLLVGIGMNSIRNDAMESSNISTTVNEIIYGNTFSDLRDGAFVLYGFENKYDEYLYGKNYLADIMGFIPSSISEYRQKWSYGRFVTSDLFGWENHYGLRGGLFLEPYINFGLVGICVFSCIFAYFSSALERIFYNRVILKENIENIEIQLIILDLIKTIAFSFMITSGFPNIYPKILIIIGMILISAPIKKYK